MFERIANVASLAAEVLRVAEGPQRPVCGPLATAHAWVDLPLRQLSRERLTQLAGGPLWDAHNAARILALMDTGHELPSCYPAPLAVWQFDRDFTLVALCGETTSGYIAAVEAALGADRLWVAGYTNQVFGYLPTSQIVAQGGYERIGLVHDVGFFAAETLNISLRPVRLYCTTTGRVTVIPGPVPGIIRCTPHYRDRFPVVTSCRPMWRWPFKMR